FANTISVVEVTGQQILDALEMGAREWPEENGGFLQVSGMSYEIDTQIPSSVKTDDTGAFIGVEGEYRVKNVKISGRDLETEKKYVLSATDYILRDCGDGYTMFTEAKRINESFILDSEAVIEYVSNGLNGHIGKEYEDPYGEGRIIETGE
ncbi:MAG TPA: 5'-nucleotidase, partial [Lachnospiraceae bacterium]|nr:5'-nucleotidase [Lachnospiraceae bacterium]